ncbi:hypothetical protein Poli38472_011801 [Pythium oligandrum]|uniref:Elicitin n=1 Tax=Pythium oligandrum TaxID=41045 RepID=A0A8K1FGY2_PYTOL|nr:hypothetical protein Poli38472_011801 [Pythium oligandrum]|eukprot:TMW58213.1 hypothetical protein Poli38472_011801 [Pythium oligandrum]
MNTRAWLLAVVGSLAVSHEVSADSCDLVKLVPLLADRSNHVCMKASGFFFPPNENPTSDMFSKTCQEKSCLFVFAQLEKMVGKNECKIGQRGVYSDFLKPHKKACGIPDNSTSSLAGSLQADVGGSDGVGSWLGTSTNVSAVEGGNVANPDAKKSDSKGQTQEVQAMTSNAPAIAMSSGLVVLSVLASLLA